jgi:NADH-quinone oxidoreductase subunit L
VHNKPVWVLAVATALMTAFYMFRLMAMTFFGAYRGPAWEAAGHGAGAAKDVHLAAQHGAPHPADAHAHGHAAEPAHDLTHGPADDAHAAHDDHGGGGHGHGPWHGPHESPAPMTYPLMALAVGAIVVGFFGIPAAIGGPETIKHFLEPSFTAERVVTAEATAAPEMGMKPEATTEQPEEPEVSHAEEIGLMGFSVLIALFGIGVAWKFYVTSPEISENLAQQFAGAHRTLSNKYYVDELYQATVISGTMAAGRGLWTFDRNVVDGAVNGTSWFTQFSSWLSGLADRTIVDGAVNLVGWIVEEGSYWFRRLQTGLVQNYALLMLFGIFAFVSIYLFVR